MLTPPPRDRSGATPSSDADGDDEVVRTLLAMLPGADRVAVLRHVANAVEPAERARALGAAADVVPPAPQPDSQPAQQLEPQPASRATDAERREALQRALDVGAISPALFARAARELGE